MTTDEVSNLRYGDNETAQLSYQNSSCGESRFGHRIVQDIYDGPRERSNISKAALFVVSALVAGALVCRGKLHQNANGVYSLESRSHSTNESTMSVFPPNFIWGAATSAYQVEGGSAEGGRGASIWDTWCLESHDNCNGDAGNVADDHFHHWKEDVDLMKNMGLKAYRFSISWSRILPNGTAHFVPGKSDTEVAGINYEGIKFYDDLINALLDAGIQPFVTLYHWDLPQALQDRYGGWIDRSIIHDFADYARICFHFYGDRVKRWITINEGWTVAIHGYEEASNAPGVLGEDVGGTGEPYLVGHHLLLAHAKAVRVFREEGYCSEGALIGLSNSGDYRFPLDASDPDDVDAATRAMEFQLGWMTDPIWLGDYPASMRKILGERLPQFTPDELKELVGSADFLGLNHYSSAVASNPESPLTYGGYWGIQSVILSSNPSWKKSYMGWNIAPEGAREMLLWIDQRYHHPLIFVTENGMAAYEPDKEHSIHDVDRVEYLSGYIRGFGQAVAQGVNLGGYFAWSLMDNFEWQYGYSKRFGLVHVNYTTFVRTPKASARWYGETIACNGENVFHED